VGSFPSRGAKRKLNRNLSKMAAKEGTGESSGRETQGRISRGRKLRPLQWNLPCVCGLVIPAEFWKGGEESGPIKRLLGPEKKLTERRETEKDHQKKKN